MHPRQPVLPPETEPTWIAAVGDAGLDPDDCLLFLLNGAQSETGYSGWHFIRRVHIFGSPQLGAQVNQLLAEMNSPDCIDAVRIVVWRERTIEGVAGLIRHELEHALQEEAHGERLERLYHLAVSILAERFGGVPSSGIFYTIIPIELDANAAAAVFVRGRFGDDRVRELLEARDEDSALFRAVRGPGPMESLPERLLAFFIAHRDLCEAYAAGQGLAFRQLLEHAWPGAGNTWRELVENGAVVLPR